MANEGLKPTLGQLLPLEKIPNELEGIREAIENLLDDVYVSNLTASQSYNGSYGYYSMSLITVNSIGVNIPIAEDLKLILNPTNQNTSEIRVTLDYSWRILKYFRGFNYETFDGAAISILRIFIDLAGISQSQLLYDVVTAFYPGFNGMNQFVSDFNSAYAQSISTPSDPNKSVFDKAEDVSHEILDLNYDLIDVIFNISFNTGSDALKRIKEIFTRYFANVDNNFNEAVKLNFKAVLQELSVGLQFPRKWLVPVYTGNEPVTGLEIDDPLPEGYFSVLRFDVGRLEYSSWSGFKFYKEFDFNLNRSMIANTGLIAEFEGLKVDLQAHSNIPEAVLDGRPENFRGVYAEYAAITLPRRWFNNADNSTIRIAGYNLLIGTGGVSGTIALETVNGTPTTIDDFMWVNLGTWRIGFNSFDITFKQSDIVSSNIRARLEIPNFKKPDGTIAQIDVTGNLEANGDFKLTASTTPPYPTIDFGDIFRFHMKSVELGREDGDFFIGASCDVEFLGMMGSFLEGQSISISSLRIYSNGRIEFKVDGGNLTLPKPIKLNLGPVQVSVTAIHFGSTERQKDGKMRKYNYFGFDGGVNVGVAGLDARGDGIKFYYTVDNNAAEDKEPHSYLHIQTIYIDLVIPANSSDPTVMIKGWLSIPEPGTTPEYRGGVSLKLKNPRITGKVDMRLAPKYPAFLIDAAIELPNPIALGPVSIFGFRGLLGYRYVAEKEAIGMTSENTWYEYYTAPVRGVDVNKFNGPENTKEYSNPISLGVGALLGDTTTMGNVISANAMLLLSLPSMIMVDARMKLLSSRVTFDDDPPFFAFFIIGDNSMEFGFGADYRFPESSGDIIKIYAEIQAGFFFDKPSAWYINIGTEERPISASLLAGLFSLKAYVMISGKGIRAGARGEFRFERNIGPIGIKFLAYLELGGRISFERPQMGGYFETGVMADVNFVIIRVTVSLTLLLAVESPKPFMVYGKFSVSVSIKVLFVKLKVKGQIELKWEYNREVDQTPISPLSDIPSQLDSLVKGVSMLTGETFNLANLKLADGSINLDLAEIRKHVIPLDTYIDIKTNKGMVPSTSVKNMLGGVSNPPENSTDLIPPERIMKGIELRQVKHQYSIEEIQIMAYSPTAGWQPFNPFRSMYPTETDPMVDKIKAGQWQKKDKQYNAIRLLATTPFSYVEQGEPSWFTPEYYGVGATTLFCQAPMKVEHISHFLDKPLGTLYYGSQTNFFQQMEASYQVFGDTTYNVNNNGAIVPVGEYGEVTGQSNPHGYDQSLAFSQSVPLIIMLSGPSVEVHLKLTTFNSGLRIEFYRSVIDTNSSFVKYQLEQTRMVNSSQAQNPIISAFLPHLGVSKIVITTTGENFTGINLFHEVKWITVEDYDYNINVPSQQYITEDAQATAHAVNNYLPPIWRPDTSYYVSLLLKDSVDNGENEAFYEYAYGFHTPGPVGFFHTDEYSPYGPLTHNESDEYPHASLRSYIDYDRSYPNANGDLVSAKPMFYNDTQTGVNLFFKIRYIEKMLNGWEAYGVFPELGGTMKIIIKDPVEDVNIVNPPNIETTEQSIELSPLPIPQTIESWMIDLNPLISPVEKQWFNMLPNGCIAVTEPLEPLSYYRKIETRRLKPQKLYTVQVMNFFWGTANINPEEITPEIKDNYARIIHEYVFQTSRYRNFEDQVKSYYMYADDGVTVEQEAVYTIEKELDATILAAARSTIQGTPDATSQSLETQFLDPFDRVAEGIFALPMLQKSVRTEINRIVDTNTGTVQALLVRNPEPFNNPRFPLKVVTGSSSQKGMIEVLFPDQVGADTSYLVLYSKDYSNALIMHTAGAITAATLHFNFVYRTWNGNNYAIVEEQQLINVPIN